ncbi:MAG: MFS transporter [Chloroflexota bacterium]
MRRDLILVAIALMIWGVGEGLFLFFQPLYLQELGANPSEIGRILGIVGLAMTVAHLPAGYLSDRLGRKPLMVAAWILGAASAWIMALAKDLPFFVLGSALYGLTSFVMVPINSYLTAARGNWSVGRVITLVAVAYNTGAILGPLLGGWLGAQSGLQRNFLLSAILFLFSSAAILFIRPQPVDAQPQQAKKGVFSGLLTTRYLIYLSITFITMFSMFLPQPLSQNFLQNERGVNLVQMGFLISARSLGVVGLNLVLGQLSARLGFLLAQVAMALFALLIWQGGWLPWYALGYFLLGGYQTARYLAIAQSRELISAANMGLGYGLVETFVAMAAILAPPLAGWLYDWHPPSIYYVSLILIGFTFIINLSFSQLRSTNLDNQEEKP